MGKVLLRIALVITAGIGAVAVLLLLSYKGVIPSTVGPADSRYARMCGWKPSSGSIWTWSDGFVDGFTYYRLHLKKGDYKQPGAVLLTSANHPGLRSPWWWGCPPNGKAVIYSSVGMGHDLKAYEIYDPVSEELSVYCEW